MGSSVHDDIGDGRNPAMPCTDSQPTRNVRVAGFVAGEGGGEITKIAPKVCCTRLPKRYGGRHTAQLLPVALSNGEPYSGHASCQVLCLSEQMSRFPSRYEVCRA
jgi:hypothetical protein